MKPYVFRTAEGSAICDRILTAFERMSLHKPRKHLRAGGYHLNNSVTTLELTSDLF